MRVSRSFGRAVTGACVAASVCVAFAEACGTELMLEPGEGGAPDGSRVEGGPAADGPEGDGGGRDADGGDGASLRCGQVQRCSGTVRIDESFAALPATWIQQGEAVSLDRTLYASPPASVHAITLTAQTGGLIATDVNGGAATVCVELCAHVDYDLTMFGDGGADGGADYIQLFALGLHRGSGERAGGFSFGLASREYTTSDDGIGAVRMAELFDAGAFPRSRWAHFRVVLEYGVEPRYELFVDGAPTLAGPLAVPSASFTGMRVSVGAFGAGTHSTVDVHYDDLLVTTSF
jgi:hypothetical protein